MNLVLRVDTGRVATLQMNRPERRNALSAGLVDSLMTSLEELADDDTIGAIIITGNGKAFCAGGDLAGGMGATGGFLDSHKSRGSFGALMKSMELHPKPIIAALNGDALGGGFGVAMACDLVVADAGARMGTPEIRLGLFPHVILAVLQRNISRKNLMEMILTGEKFGMERALELGIVNKVASEGDVQTVAMEMATLIASRSPAILGLGKSAFYAIADMTFDQALAYMHSQLSLNLLTEDAMEGIGAFLQRRDPDWKGR
jgi:enoyl-CoA hydratase/carnithine racemase